MTGDYIIEDIQEGDIVQLLVRTAWHDAGELAIVKRITSNETMDIIYENETTQCTGFIVNFRRIPIELFEKKLVKTLQL